MSDKPVCTICKGAHERTGDLVTCIGHLGSCLAALKQQFARDAATACPAGIVEPAPAVEIRPEDLRVDCMAASSGVVITHVPTGLQVGRDNQASRHKNKLLALADLRELLAKRAAKVGAAPAEEPAPVCGDCGGFSRYGAICSLCNPPVPVDANLPLHRVEMIGAHGAVAATIDGEPVAGSDPELLRAWRESGEATPTDGGNREIACEATGCYGYRALVPVHTPTCDKITKLLDAAEQRGKEGRAGIP